MLTRRLLLSSSLLASGTLAAWFAGRNAQAGAASSSPTTARRLTPPAGQIPAAFLLDEGATMIDFAGPWEALQDAAVSNVPGFRLFTVAPVRELQTTGYMDGDRLKGMKVTADFGFDDAPQPKVIVMGAQSGKQNPQKLAWIRQAAAEADIVLSVCTGAFILASTGLLDGKQATTHHDFYDAFEKQFPKVHLVRNRRWVDNDKFITAGGLTSGVDAALHVIARYYGPKAAEASALYMEHYSDEWRTGEVSRAAS
jgi:transcriptional regulator GlxA family with amidase domain